MFTMPDALNLKGRVGDEMEAAGRGQMVGVVEGIMRNVV